MVCVLLFLYIVSIFIPIFNITGLTYHNVKNTQDRTSTVDYTEENLDGSMSWNNFLTDCENTEVIYDLSGFFDDITFHMEMNFDKGTITGALSGSMTSDTALWKKGLAFNGEFTGWLDKYNWNYYSWLWEFGSNFTLTLRAP
jgi:hypothetical protein